MDIATAIALIAAVLGAFVATITFVVGRILDIRRAREDSRRATLTRLLDVVENSIRRQTRPDFLKTWSPTVELEYALFLQRLVLELPKDEHVVAVWVWRQIELMQSELTEAAVNRKGLAISERLIAWHHGDVATKWFDEQVKVDPPVRSTPSRPVMWKRRARPLVSLVMVSAMLGFGAGALFRTMRSEN